MAKVRAGASGRPLGLGKRTLLCGVSCVLALAPIAHASAETLMEAMALAYEGNPNLKASRAQLRATDENVAIAASGWRPTLAVTGGITREREAIVVPGVGGNSGTLIPTTGSTTGTTTGTGTGTTGTGTTGASTPSTGFSEVGVTLLTTETMTASIDQPLFRGFRTVAGIAEAKNQVLAQRARLEQTEAAVLLQVATSYFDVLQDRAVLDLQRNNVQVLDRNLEATNDRFRVGELTRTDVAQSEASLAGAKASLVQAEGDLRMVEAAYVNVVGKAPEDLSAPELPHNVPTSLDEAVGTAIRENPNYVAADYTARAQKDNIRVVEGALLPSADLIGEYVRGWNTISPGSTTSVLVGTAQVTVPLYQQGAEWSRLRQAKDTYGQYLLLADQARLDARSTATTAWEGLVAQTASLDSIRSQISANEISLEGVQREAEVGSRTVLDVLNAELALLNSRVQLVRTEHDQLVAAFQLLSTTGKLTGGDLGLGVKIFDPTHHYDAVRGQFIGTNSDTANDLKTRKP